MSTFPRRSDRDYANGGVVDSREPLDRRFGGWYVTGAQVPPRHMGNVALVGPARRAAGEDAATAGLHARSPTPAWCAT